LKDIRDAKIKAGNIFTIEVRTETGKYKVLEYEARDKKEGAQIVAKLGYLKNSEFKRAKNT